MTLFIQKIIPPARYFLLLWFAISIPVIGQYLQQNYTVTNGYPDSTLVNSKFRNTVSFGQYIVIDNMTDNLQSTSTGIFGFYQLPPTSPRVIATQGDFPDRVEISWSFDVLSPPANMDFFHLYRDNVLLSTIAADQLFYKDFNIQPGVFYSYTVTGVNKYGTSPIGSSVGFVNPNGTITGKITTSNGTPVNDVEILITPNLGKSLFFNGYSNYVEA
ncbi:MAG: hypothetical protein HYV28_15265, partial [Ignavibacteriales bacterium]|nr:hypothetical protein [Ignavibacteriales bacterium]